MSGILHPTDFSPASGLAFEHALALALARRVPLTLIHVHGPGDAAASWHDFPHIRERLARWGLMAAGAGAEDVARETGVSVRKVEAEGASPAETIAHHIDMHPQDWVVMASHGRSGPSAWLRPSVTGELASLSTVPILAVTEDAKSLVDAAGRLALGRLLVAVDHEPDPQAGVEAAARFAGPDAEIVALHVGEEPLDPPVAAPHGHALRSVTEAGEPAETIAAVAARIEADVIAVVRSGPDSMRERLFGSTTERLLGLSPCPVLIVPAPSYAAQPPV